VVSSTEQLGALDQQTTQALSNIEKDAEELSIVARAVADAMHKRAAAATAAKIAAAQKAAAAAAAAAQVNEEVPETPVQPVVQAAPTTTTTTTAVRAQNSGRLIIAVISAAVLVLLLLISVATVRSIMGPIRRFMNTTRRLANGDTDARVGRGGIKELDTLAQSFNEMADKLAAAQATTSSIRDSSRRASMNARAS